MKLNPDCIRDILIYIENKSTFSNAVMYSSDDIPNDLSKYSHETIIYHLSQCTQNEYFNGCQSYDSGDTWCIGDLTPKAHEFLADIRNDTVWNKTKEIGRKIGVGSLKSLVSIAGSVASNIIGNYFGASN